MTHKNMVNIGNLIDLKTYANDNDMDAKRLRRACRNGDLTTGDGVYHIGRTYMVDKNANVVLPPTKTRGTKRVDGRSRYVVYVNDDELAQITKIIGAGNVIDVRAIASAKRAAKRHNDTNGK